MPSAFHLCLMSSSSPADGTEVHSRGLTGRETDRDRDTETERYRQRQTEGQWAHIFGMIPSSKASHPHMDAEEAAFSKFSFLQGFLTPLWPTLMKRSIKTESCGVKQRQAVPHTDKHQTPAADSDSLSRMGLVSNRKYTRPCCALNEGDGGLKRRRSVKRSWATETQTRFHLTDDPSGSQITTKPSWPSSTVNKPHCNNHNFSSGQHSLSVYHAVD